MTGTTVGHKTMCLENMEKHLKRSLQTILSKWEEKQKCNREKHFNELRKWRESVLQHQLDIYLKQASNFQYCYSAQYLPADVYFLQMSFSLSHSSAAL